jgi:hypothetical protein
MNINEASLDLNKAELTQHSTWENTAPEGGACYV